MKWLLTPLLILFSLAAHSQDNLVYEYAEATEFSADCDFNGDGKPDTLTQFIADSLGMKITEYRYPVIQSWDLYVNNYSTMGYQTIISLKGSTPLLTFKGANGVILLTNLGNINNTPGDEVAVMANNIDHSRHSYCHIYSLCNATWQEVFVFSVHEDSFDDFDPITIGYIPNVLEQKNGVWVYYDYLDMEYDNPEEVGNMLPLKVRDCE
ncbi:hypothetical protein AM493_18220 [Flavobacterium akiainvivens]|uniref:Uncharacterized protein n=1 Tax=Flavobacterium akiainvivens TaxID=1202724 RepID=A0A0M8MK02_9FLAO|nr:hypothetical protein [Flavobacterium akiainvivens]KOS07771.1 hypothetical protein AM493_18220 [Flavobacterium akiainvivens]SFQ25974.1 hypothetical protein SAMN05444144_102225 [Flavobacterium akiainvivens]